MASPALPKPTPLERELLLVLAEEQRRFEQGEWDFNTTLWSRVAYRMAKARGKVAPSPVWHKANLDRHFKSVFTRTVKRLLSRKLMRYKLIRGPGKLYRWQEGYNKHRRREKDIFLTALGKQFAEELSRPRTAQARVEFTYVYQKAPRPAPKELARKQPKGTTSFTLTLTEPEH